MPEKCGTGRDEFVAQFEVQLPALFRVGGLQAFGNGIFNRLIVHIEVPGEQFEKAFSTFAVEDQICFPQLGCPGAGRDFSASPFETSINHFP
ncbi:MAG: hypothetical protein ACD_75C00553G0008 [uncultured bacterium]|nr:MAG: hypothetical protein ACD_75C00553G0008 [uncultured bacterium]